MTHVTDEELGKLSRQWHDLFRRVREGSLDVEMASVGLQGVIEGKYPHGLLIAESHQEYEIQPPTWWRTPEQQLERARQLWPDVVLPEPPKKFIPRTESEVLLLHVPDSFGFLWENVEVPVGGSDKYGMGDATQDPQLAPNKREYTKPIWLAFDPEHGKGERPDLFWERADIAASEILSALIQFPEWPRAWRGSASAPNLSGYRLDASFSSFNMLYVYFSYPDFGLYLNSGYVARPSWSSPVVREC